MKIFTFSILLAMITTLSLAQKPDFKKEMKNALHVHDTASSVSSEIEVVRLYENLAELFPEQWLPHYWASYIYTQIYSTGYEAKQMMVNAQTQLDLADKKLINRTDGEDSDIKALQAFIYYFLAQYPDEKEVVRAELLKKYDNEIKAALRKNPDNPLVDVLVGTYLIGKKENVESVIGGRALLKIAWQKFGEETEHRALTTQWNQEWLQLFWLNFADKQLQDQISSEGK